MEKHIALLRGDGIGPEIVDSAVRVLTVVAEKFGHTFTFTPYLIGGAAIDATGAPLPQETVDGCLAADSVLLGAPSGIPCPPICARRRACWASARRWACTPICARRSSILR